MRRLSTLFILLFSGISLVSNALEPRLTPVGEGYCRTSVNAAVFRGSSIVSNDSVQYVSYYDSDGYVVIGKRRLDSDSWIIKRSQYQGNVKDGHNVISIGLDGKGFLHVSFDHHGHPLKYCRSVSSGSMDLGELEPMTGRDEKDVTYPEFYTMPDGDLLFAYRSGASGRGNLVLNRYDTKKGEWRRIQDVLIDGENERNAYWQLYVDRKGVIHLSWVWRETWLVETNHDLCYAVSKDGGTTWQRSDGTRYNLPIVMKDAEIAWHIPQNSELINQTSMTADKKGRPYIATYWRDENDSIPQYRLVWHDGKKWDMSVVGNRKTPFSLSGGGTKMIPISRPRIASDGKAAYYIFRDSERGSKISVAHTLKLGKAPWRIEDVTDFSVDAWEPTFDINAWNKRNKLNIFVQEVHQGDGESLSDNASLSTPVSILSLED